MKYQRKCKSCGGKVSLFRTTWKNEIPARDHRGRFIEITEKRDGQWITRQQTFTVTVRGLGHWLCANGCQKRNDSVTRFAGCGKEQERNRHESFHRVRDIVVETHIARAAIA